MSGNRFMQRKLQKRIDKLQYYLGIVSGDKPGESGEMGVFDLVRKKCLTPYCVFDVGANTGQYLNLILKCFSKNKLTIHCFEPSSFTFNTLKSNSPSNKKIILNNMALGNQKGEVQLYYHEQKSGLASLTKRRLDHFHIYFNQNETIEVDTVDNYCSNHNIDKISLLKIDVEGHELDVLSGASQMLQNRAIDIITFEFGGTHIDTRCYFQDFFYFFKNVGMNILRITPSGYLYPIKSYSENLEQFRTTNYVAIKD